MKKVQKALALGLGLALCAGVFVACGGDDDNKGPSEKAGDKSSYYIVGNFSDATLPQDSAWGNQHCATPADVPDGVSFKATGTSKVYELTVNLYENDMFQVVITGQAWSNQMGYKTFKEYFDADTAGNFQAHDSYPVDDIQVVNSGKYKFTLTMTDELKPVIAYERVGEAPKLPNPVKGIMLNKTLVGLEVSEDTTKSTFQIEPTINPVDADEKDDITYVSDHPEFATVSETGLVTAVAKGSATITVTCGEKTAELSVTVVNEGEKVSAESIAIEEEVTIQLGQKEELVATVLPEETLLFDAVVWMSSDETVATVNQTTGEVTAVKPGTATITATIGTGESEKTAECEVTVPDTYYVVGKLGAVTNEWNTNLSKLDPNAVLAVDATTPGKYTWEAVLAGGDVFKLLLASDPSNWDIAIAFDKLVDTANKFYNGGSGNITCMDAAKYRFTLEMVDDTESEEEGAKKPQLTYELLEDKEDTVYESYPISVYGTGNGWASAYEEKSATVSATSEWKCEITLDLAEGEVFQFRQERGEGNTNYIGKSQSVTGANDVDNLFDSHENNYKCKAEGTYKFTLTFNDKGYCLSVVVEEVTD